MREEGYDEGDAGHTPMKRCRATCDSQHKTIDPRELCVSEDNHKRCGMLVSSPGYHKVIKLHCYVYPHNAYNMHILLVNHIFRPYPSPYLQKIP